MFSSLKSVFLFTLLVLLGACAGTLAAPVDQNQVAARERDCAFNSTVRIVLVRDDGAFMSVGGVFVGDDRVITDAYVPFRQADRIYAMSTGVGGVSHFHAHVTVEKVDMNRGLAILNVPNPPVCEAVLADMMTVRVGDRASVNRTGTVGERGTVLSPYHPFSGPGRMNDVMRLSKEFADVVPGTGIYAENGTLLGVKVGDSSEGGDTLALPADRIARFLEANAVPYKQYDDGLVIRSFE